MTDMIFDRPDVLVGHSATIAEFMAGMHRDCHPLTVWYDKTPSADPQTSGRVPDGLVPPNRRAVLVNPLIRLGVDQQMTLYHRRDGVTQSFFVVARDRRDFDDDDLVVARYVQRSLVTLDRQSRVLEAGGCGDPEASIGTNIGLTGRELAVLQLLCDGLSTRQASRRLACSPRTIEKHLQHIYRKLEVRDRVNAVRIAHLAGAVMEQPEPARPIASSRVGV